MMLVPYHTDDSSESYHKYYATQAGYGMNVFKGSTAQAGHGIGSFFRGIARSSLPLLKTAARKALSVGASMASDALEQGSKLFPRWATFTIYKSLVG